MSKAFSWYSNKDLGWIWGRSFAISLICGVLTYLLLPEAKGKTLIIAVLIPVLLGLVNTFAYFEYKKKNKTNEKI